MEIKMAIIVGEKELVLTSDEMKELKETLDKMFPPDPMDFLKAIMIESHCAEEPKDSEEDSEEESSEPKDNDTHESEVSGGFEVETKNM